VVRRAFPAFLATAALAAGCGAGDGPSEADRLQSFTGLAQAQAFTYEAGAAVGYAEARRCLDPQRAFVRELRIAVEEAGGTPPMPQETIAQVEDVLPGLAAVRSREDFLRFAGELEAAARSAWAADELGATGLRAPAPCVSANP
jgi:hypothetical protein